MQQLTLPRYGLSDVNWANPVSDHGLNDGLVAWYLAGGPGFGSVKWYDIAGHNHGTLTNMDPATDWRGTSRPGGFGALDFDGSDDYVDCGHIPTLEAADLTMSVWCKPSVVTGARWVVQQYEAKGPSIFFIGDDVYWQVGGNDDRVIESDILVANEWVHIAGTLRGVESALFINGKRVGTNTVSPEFGSTDDSFTMGGPSEGGVGLFSGCLDDVRIYGLALSTAEIAALYDISRHGYPGLLNRIGRRMFSVPADIGGSSAFPFHLYYQQGASL